MCGLQAVFVGGDGFFNSLFFFNFSQSGLISLFSLFTTSLLAHFGIALATFAILSQWLCIPGCLLTTMLGYR